MIIFIEMNIALITLKYIFSRFLVLVIKGKDNKEKININCKNIR